MTGEPTPETIRAAKTMLEEAGYVVIKESSYRRAQERQRVAEALKTAAEDERDGFRRWAEDCLRQERQLRDRLTFVYGVATAHGATVDDLRQPDSASSCEAHADTGD